MNIRTVREARRGCGWRQGGGLYLVAGSATEDCRKLPIVLDVCPTCHHGIKPSRGWTWIDVSALLPMGEPRGWCGLSHCPGCPLSIPIPDRVGLLWVGEKFYPTPGHFLREGMKMGVSRRISAIPKDFVLGETWVCFAHRTVRPLIDGGVVNWKPGIFAMFRPDRIEYVVKGDEDPEKLERMVKRGIDLVKVERIENGELELGKVTK